MLESLQKEWETLKNQQQFIQKQEENLLQKITEQGYAVIEGQIVKNDNVYGMTVNFGYYQGHNTFDKVTGMVEVPLSLYQQLRTAFEAEPVQHETISTLISQLTKVDNYFFHNGMEKGRFEYFDEDEEDEYLLCWSLCKGFISSEFSVSKEKRSVIAQNPITHK